MTVLDFPARNQPADDADAIPGFDPGRIFDPCLYHAGVLLNAAADVLAVNGLRRPCTPQQPCPVQPAPQCVTCALTFADRTVFAPKGTAPGSLVVALAAASAAGLRIAPVWTVPNVDATASALRTTAAHIFNEALPAGIRVWISGEVD